MHTTFSSSTVRRSCQLDEGQMRFEFRHRSVVVILGPAVINREGTSGQNQSFHNVVPTPIIRAESLLWGG